MATILNTGTDHQLAFTVNFGLSHHSHSRAHSYTGPRRSGSVRPGHCSPPPHHGLPPHNDLHHRGHSPPCRDTDPVPPYSASHTGPHQPPPTPHHPSTPHHPPTPHHFPPSTPAPPHGPPTPHRPPTSHHGPLTQHPPLPAFRPQRACGGRSCLAETHCHDNSRKYFHNDFYYNGYKLLHIKLLISICFVLAIATPAYPPA